MRRPLMRTLLLGTVAAALGVSSAFLVACGDRNDLIPPSDASAMQSDLDRASDLYAQEECRASQAAVINAQSRAARLPSEVDSDLRATLAENLRQVLQDIRQKCGRTQTTQTTQTTATTPTTTPTTPTTTETTPTTTETTTETTPTTTETTPNPSDSGGTPPGQTSRKRGKGKQGKDEG